MTCATRILTVTTIMAVGLAISACGQPDDQPVRIVDSNDDNGSDNTNQNNTTTSGGDLPDGSACTEDDECANDSCLGAPDWPEGYCSSVNCQSDADCEDGDHDSFCLQNPQGNDFCARSCDTDETDPCRDDYVCLSAPVQQRGWCSPEPDDYDPSDNDDNGQSNGDPDDVPLDITCESVSAFSPEFTYEIDDDTESYLVVPFSPNGELIAPEGITTPSGQFYDFENDYPFLLLGSQMFGIVNPTLIPATPQLQYKLESGQHTYHIPTNDDEICYYVLQDSGAPTTIELNIYLVGVPGVDAGSADDDDDLQHMLDETEAILQQAGIQLGEVRFFDVPDEAEQQYSVIRSREDIHDLVAYSEEPTNDSSDLVSANVFITEQFSLSDSDGTVGTSLGIPGAAGLHGSPLSGVAMSGEFIGEFGGGNEYSAVIMAHELGHFLGLFHTSEQGGEAIDPLEDTPECSNLSSPTTCPDWGNLMFPMGDAENDELTDDQSYVIGTNPLTR